MASEKRCLYEVLGVARDCSPDEIRSAYKKLALQRHPDKLVQSGLTQAEATAQFQELVHAYEVLSDPKERSWYDSHRSQILFSDRSAAADSPIPNLFSFFSNTVYSGYSDAGKGFYKVYSDLFYKIYSNEINFAKKMGLGLDAVREAPLMGNLESPCAQVTAFYNYWLGYSTVMDFGWVDQYDVMAGTNRKSRRVMEEENKKLRKKAKREFNDTVRGLAEFARKRDKRVIDMTMKKKEEVERKRAEERERKKRMEREKMEKARAYEDPDWAKTAEEDDDDWEDMNGNVGEGKEKEELYCVACGKKFKSEKQWKNHEQSKKHKERVASLRETFAEEEEEDLDEAHADESSANVSVEDVEGSFRKVLEIDEEEEGDGFYDAEEGEKEDIEIDGDEDEHRDDGDAEEETSVLESMVSRHKNRQNLDKKMEDELSQKGARVEDGSDDEDFMRYDKQKSTRRSRGKKETANKGSSDSTRGDLNGTRSKHNDAIVEDNLSMEEDHSSHSFAGNGSTYGQSVKSHKISAQHVDKKGSANKDANVKLKNSSKGKKAKAAAKHCGNLCDTCGEEFQSRNRLHKHLGETGHATLKFR